MTSTRSCSSLPLILLLCWFCYTPAMAKTMSPDDILTRTTSIPTLQNRFDRMQGEIGDIQRRRRQLKDNVERLTHDHEMLEEQLTTISPDVSPQLAELLRKRRDQIARAVTPGQIPRDLDTELSQARLQLLRLEEIFRVATAGGIDNSRITKLQTQILDAANQKIDELETLQKLIVKARTELDDYQSLLDEHLFWLPSVDAIGPDTLDNLAESLAWLFNHLRLSSLNMLLRDTRYTQKRNAALGFAAFIALLSFRRRCKSTLSRVAPSVGNVGKDHFGLTIVALVATILLALPWSVLLIAGALLVPDLSSFGDALSNGFMQMAAIMFLLSLLSHSCRPQGLGEVHFRWRQETLDAVRRATRGLLFVLLPATLITTLTESGAAEAFRGSLGRVAFVAASVGLWYFGRSILKTRPHALAERRSRKLIRLSQTVAVWLPLAIMVLSLLGYHYTGVALEGTLFVSVCWVLLVMLVFYLALRAVAVNERQLTLARLREIRAGAQERDESREAAESAGEGLPTSLDIPQMDLADISAQARALVGMAAALTIGVGLWVLWSNVFPAFNVFNDVVLWTVAGTGSNADTLATVTLQGLALAIVIAFMTFFAARNLPGLLEVAFLSRTDLSPGTGYAVRTISSYLIVITGTIIALGMLGAEWAKLQWLVAALGVGLGFGLQEIVANFISGIIILFERPMRVGDTVTVGDQTGTVSRIRIRATTITGWDLKELIIPNKTFVTEQLTNWTLSNPLTRVTIFVTVAYTTDVDHAQRVLEEVVLANENVIDDPPPAVFCVAFEESRIRFEIRGFISNIMDYMPLTHELHAAAIQALRQSGIDIPFPQLDMYVKSIPPSSTSDDAQ